MDVFTVASLKLAEKVNQVFAEKGYTDEAIQESKDIVENQYEEFIPEEYHGKHFPVLGLLENRLTIGWVRGDKEQHDKNVMAHFGIREKEVATDHILSVSKLQQRTY